MIIWSIQPKKVLDILESGKSFRCDGRRSIHLRSYGFRIPYKWMVQQMRKRGLQKDDRYPVWGWYRYCDARSGRKAPTLQQLKNIFENEYRLKLKVPDELVLLSDYDDWHMPLNNCFCGSDRYVIRMMTAEDNKTWSPEKLQRLKEKSWEKIFNIENATAVQACFPSIEPEYLLKSDKI